MFSREPTIVSSNKIEKCSEKLEPHVIVTVTNTAPDFKKCMNIETAHFYRPHFQFCSCSSRYAVVIVILLHVISKINIFEILYNARLWIYVVNNRVVKF